MNFSSSASGPSGPNKKQRRHTNHKYPGKLDGKEGSGDQDDGRDKDDGRDEDNGRDEDDGSKDFPWWTTMTVKTIVKLKKKRHKNSASLKRNCPI